MKKVLFVLMLPMLLGACGSKSATSSTPKDFQQSYKVEEEKKGSKVSASVASQRAKAIGEKMEEKTTAYSSDTSRFIEDSKQFSYSFKNVIDDSLYLNSYVNYSSNEEFFSQKIEVLSKEDNLRHTSTNYEYVMDEKVIEAFVNEDGTGYYYTYQKEGYQYNGIFAFLSEMILECGNQMKNLLQQTEVYMGGSVPGGTTEFRSSGEGNLYMKFSIPSSGITMEVLFEDYWLTYEYMYTDLTQLMKDMPKEYRDLIQNQRMVTELHIDFQHAEVNRPNLDNLKESK